MTLGKLAFIVLQIGGSFMLTGFYLGLLYLLWK